MKLLRSLTFLGVVIGISIFSSGCGGGGTGGTGGTGPGTGGGGVVIPAIHHQIEQIGSAFITERNRAYRLTCIVRETNGTEINFTSRTTSGSGLFVSRSRVQEPSAYLDGRDFGYPAGRVTTTTNNPFQSAWDLGAFERRIVSFDVLVGDPFDPFSTPLGYDGIIINQSELFSGSGSRQYSVTYQGADSTGRAYQLTYTFNVNVSISSNDPFDPFPGSGSGGGTDPNDPFGGSTGSGSGSGTDPNDPFGGSTGSGNTGSDPNDPFGKIQSK